MAKSCAERNREADARKRARGLTRVCVWVPNEYRGVIKDKGRIVSGEPPIKISKGMGTALLCAFKYIVGSKNELVKEVVKDFLLTQFSLGNMTPQDLELLKKHLRDMYDSGVLTEEDKKFWYEFVDAAHTRIEVFYSIVERVSKEDFI